MEHDATAADAINRLLEIDSASDWYDVDTASSVDGGEADPTDAFESYAVTRDVPDLPRLRRRLTPRHVYGWDGTRSDRIVIDAITFDGLEAVSLTVSLTAETAQAAEAFVDEWLQLLPSLIDDRRHRRWEALNPLLGYDWPPEPVFHKTPHVIGPRGSDSVRAYPGGGPNLGRRR